MSRQLEIGNPNPQPNIVRVSIPAEIAYDLDRFTKIQKELLGRLGCLACCSGKDIRWEIYHNYAVDLKGNLHETIQQFR